MNSDEKEVLIIVIALAVVYVVLTSAKSTAKTNSRYKKPKRVNQMTGGTGVDPHSQSPYTVESVFDSSGLSNGLAAAALVAAV